MVKPKVFVTPTVFSYWHLEKDYFDFLKNKFHVHCIREDHVSRETTLEAVKDSFAILTTSKEEIDEEIVKRAGKNLKIVSVLANGHDKVDKITLKKYGVRLGTAGNVIVPATAEMALTLLLVASRKFMPLINGYTRDVGIYYSLWDHPAAGLEDSVVGIVGAGRIGHSVARKVVQFDINRMLYFSRSKKIEMEKLGGVFSSIETIARNCDYIVVCLVLNKQTERIINKNIFEQMKSNAVIVNISRGALIDQNALLEALQQKKIGGAALDVTTPEPLPLDDPLRKMENVVISPHLGGTSAKIQQKIMITGVENIIAVHENRKMPEEIIL